MGESLFETRMIDPTGIEEELVLYVLRLPLDYTFNRHGWEVSRGLIGLEAEAVRARLEKKLAELEATGHLRPSGNSGCWVKTTEPSDYRAHAGEAAAVVDVDFLTEGGPPDEQASAEEG